tara:strand:+ start:317 stop:469 length:153 start_codon:yes stop_codon:yes gene_type:complete
MQHGMTKHKKNGTNNTNINQSSTREQGAQLDVDFFNGNQTRTVYRFMGAK